MNLNPETDTAILANKVSILIRKVEQLATSLKDAEPNHLRIVADRLKVQLSEFQLTINGGDIDDAVDTALKISRGAKTTFATLTLMSSLDTRPRRNLDIVKSALDDLTSYCEALIPKIISTDDIQRMANWGSGSFAQSEKVLDKRYAELDAQAEKTARAMTSMEARLKAMGETADNAVARVEELTVQQADAMRAALTREVSGITEGFAGTKQALQERVSEFDGFREQAKSLLGQMAAEVLAGGHVKSAQAEEASADSFRFWALVAMGAGAVVILLVLVLSYFQPFSWAGLTYRAIVSLLFVVPTAYLARESAKHRAQAIELRRASLDFAALEPFLKDIEGEEGLKVRAELARRAFFTGNAVDSSSSYGLDPQALILKAMDIAADAVKKK